MIELAGIGRDFDVGGQPVHALSGIDLVIPDGDYLSLMGPSGSGKSTLLNIIGCLDRPSAGSYVLDGRQVAALPEEELSLVRRYQIGFVFQFYHLVPRLTAAGNVELPMIFAGVERGERRLRVARALEAVGLSARARHRSEQLSGGERQRVAIARAIVMGPSILLADEPTGNLDTAAGAEIVHLLELRNAEGLTLVVVTHDPDIGRRARHRLRLVDGKIVSEEGAVGRTSAAAGARAR
ncbi:MAG TPA: ABC transporter ATP-binding protein [Thermoanaerobaculia bacterium]|nr:ABC transporter ATP-binding protein [Thermoanaerobaculia bacterium]